jgi:hypothetical protein
VRVEDHHPHRGDDAQPGQPGQLAGRPARHLDSTRPRSAQRPRGGHDGPTRPIPRMVRGLAESYRDADHPHPMWIITGRSGDRSGQRHCRCPPGRHQRSRCTTRSRGSRGAGRNVSPV